MIADRAEAERQPGEQLLRRPSVRHCEPPLASKVEALLRPSTYGVDVREVEAIETHMSWVFLAGSFAYKLKKPVRYDFLDFSTLIKRRRCCEDELLLNRRLAPDVYLGLVALTLESGTNIRLNGPGPRVDWLVKMRRLSRERMLDHALSAGGTSAQDHERVCEGLIAFYRRAVPHRVSPAEYVARWNTAVLANLEALRDPAFDLPRAPILALETLLMELVRSGKVPLGGRAAEIVEGHGDLRPEHIFLGPPLAIIDCLEFNRQLRMIDPIDELSYLALECEVAGAAEFGEGVLARYQHSVGDYPAAALIAFYTAARALLRSRLSIAHLNESVVDPGRWRRKALDYFAAAERHAARLTDIVTT